jgi:O-antigen biosynthesis protein
VSTIAYVLNYLNKFRLQWGQQHLNRIVRQDTKFTHNNDRSSTSTQSAFRLTNPIITGWYMLELRLVANHMRVQVRVCIDSASTINDKAFYPFTNLSGRTNKRLIRCDVGGEFQFNLALDEDGFQILHFRLQRVSQKFAISRMLNRLQGLHPHYKSVLNNHELLGGIDMSLPVLWKDYCATFEETVNIVPYPSWAKKFDTLNISDRTKMLGTMLAFAHQPLVSITMPLHNPNVVWLDEAIASVQSQIYTHWELCIADDASTDPAVRAALERWMQADPRIKVVFWAQNGHISAASNSALELAQGEWVALLDHDDVLAEDALFWVANAINQNPSCQLIYSDEDKIDEMGVRSDPYFKSAWNQDLFYSQNMFSHLGVYKASLLRAVGGFREGFEGSQDYDLALRCIEQLPSGQLSQQIQHIPRVLYHWRIHADSIAHNIDVKPYAMVAGERAINEHLARLGVAASAESVGNGYRVRYALPAVLPLVSLIIPTRNGLQLLRQCIDSVLTKTTYAHYEIIVVDNGSDDRATLRYLDELALTPIVRVMRDARPFNYSALNNAAVKLARGSVVGLINNDIEVISPDWLTEMVSHALRPEVGAVGARLWYSDDTLQHAGVVLGIHGIAGHVHRFLPRGNVGYCGRAALIQSFSAVTGACLVVRKALYEAVGGLNEVELQVACNDIDFCLRLREAGYRNIYTPYAELYHHESASRGFDDTPEKQARSAKEVAYMHQRWGDALRNDPAYSPNLTLDAEDFSLAWPPRVAPIAQSSTATTP